jgi:hypothetical protein
MALKFACELLNSLPTDCQVKFFSISVYVFKYKWLFDLLLEFLDQNIVLGAVEWMKLELEVKIFHHIGFTINSSKCSRFKIWHMLIRTEARVKNVFHGADFQNSGFSQIL